MCLRKGQFIFYRMPYCTHCSGRINVHKEIKCIGPIPISLNHHKEKDYDIVNCYHKGVTEHHTLAEVVLNALVYTWDMNNQLQQYGLLFTITYTLHLAILILRNSYN